MKEGFLAKEAKKAHKKSKRLFSALLVIYVCLIGFVFFMGKDSFDWNNNDDKLLILAFAAFSALMLFCVTMGLFLTGRSAKNGYKSLILPFQEGSKEAVGKVIDQEASEGKAWVDEYIEAFSEGKKPKGERVVLFPSYLLLFNGMGAVTAIPRDKVYWLCAQAGIEGRSSFIVRLLIFTEKKAFALEGCDVGHLKQVADQLYQYIPNVFCEYDTFQISYELEKMFDKRREDFVKFYEHEKRQMEQGS